LKNKQKMSVGKVKISLANGAMGGLIATGDSISGLVISIATAPSGLALNTPKAIFSLSDAEGLGITQALFPKQWEQIREYYQAFNFITGSDSNELWIMLVADSVSLATVADNATTNGAKKLLNAANGRVKLLGLSRVPASGYSPTVTNGIDGDAYLAATAAQTLATTFATAQMPVRVLIEARSFTYANVGSLTDLRTLTNNRVGLVIWNSGNLTDTAAASIGFTLGLAAGMDVQRNIGRLANGALPLTTTPKNGDTGVGDMIGSWDAVHDKGYIFLLQYAGRTGYFINDDNMATALTDDYASLSRGRTIDKIQRLTYDALLDFLKTDVDVIDGGKLHPAVIATISAKVEKRVQDNCATNISMDDKTKKPAFRCYIDPEQNVLSASKLYVKMRARPKGMLKDIDASLGYTLTL
jgi:hypothetical protein